MSPIRPRATKLFGRIGIPSKRTSETQDSDPSDKSYLYDNQTLPDIGTAGDFPYYPTKASERNAFRTKTNKRVTPHQWAVYDFTLTIPSGKVTTYKNVCGVVGGSPRSVGGALRNNPFAPYVPCHRVIASNLFMGGFHGEWGRNGKTGTQCDRKLALLEKEGIFFTKAGYLRDSDATIWRGDPKSAA